ncbi:hypothetical protein G9A89_001422, partial [Geosiphon pyriformis]
FTAANLTKEAIRKQLHNKFKMTAGPTNSHYKLRAALRLYDLFHICENVLQNPILQSLKIQYIGKLTELKFQQFSDQISLIILDYYLEITDSTWTSTELSLEEEKEHLAQLNTQLCDHCLIPYNFQYCNECNLIYNPPICIIYTISEEKEPISNCTSESESNFNPDSNLDNNDENNGSSSVQNSNNNDNDSNSDSNSNSNYEQYIMLSDLTKEQELKWFSNNNEGIMPECAHDTDAEFDLRYPRKDAIKLELHLRTCIDLKITLEILATTMVQLASRSSLAKKEINIRGRIINTEYVRNIIVMLQNNSEKTYVIELNKKIMQAIFLPLVKIAQLVSVRNRKELGITARGIQGFRSTGRVDIPINIMEKEIIDKGKIISTKRKVKDQNQIFETEAACCGSGEIGLINFHIPARNYSCIKIPIYNNTGKVIEIPEETIIRHLTTKIEDQPPNPIPDFPQLCGYVDITSQMIYKQNEYYLLQPEQLEQMNIEKLDPLQYLDSGYWQVAIKPEDKEKTAFTT